VHSLGSIATFGLIENGLSLVVFGAIAFSVLISLAFLLTGGRSESAYDRIGAGGIAREGDYGSGSAGAGVAPAAGAESPAAQAEREREIRQMLGARSERLVRNGQPALDVDAELARLLDGGQGAEAAEHHDPGLLAEVRQLVQARNERRLRQGQEPLDVDAEVARTLAELDL
jgi:hypothetical protein